MRTLGIGLRATGLGLLTLALVCAGSAHDRAQALDNVTLITDFGFNGRHAYFYRRDREGLLQSRRSRRQSRPRPGLGRCHPAGRRQQCDRRVRRRRLAGAGARQRSDPGQARLDRVRQAGAGGVLPRGFRPQAAEGSRGRVDRQSGGRRDGRHVPDLRQGRRLRCQQGQVDRCRAATRFPDCSPASGCRASASSPSAHRC